MLRAVGFFGSSVALKSVCLRVVAFAMYTSPNPPSLADPVAGGVAVALLCFLPVLPRLRRDDRECRHEHCENQRPPSSGACVSPLTPSVRASSLPFS